MRPAAVPHSLRWLRLRLTAWYVGTFFAVLATLGLGIFEALTRRFDRDLDASLRVATKELAAVARVRDRSTARRGAGVADVVEDLRIPDRTLFLTDSLGRSASATDVDPWVAALARATSALRAVDTSHAVEGDRVLRVHAERFRLANGVPLVAIAAADEIELEDRYASLIAAFGAAALAALVLVAAGGWLLARQSTAPVEQAVNHMRRFMADAAHELRTPITVVRSRAEITLQRLRQPEEYVNALRGIERESARLGRIVDDLLTLARADAGERPIQRRRIFLDDVTLDAAEAARAMAERRSVRLEVDSFEEAPVTADPDLLRQLVMILLDNAVKFTPANGVVRVGVHFTASAAVLTVADTGVGIAAAQMPHVFERFYRGDVSRTRGALTEGGSSAGDTSAGDTSGGVTSEGTGLGLSIAQWIAEEHGATIKVDSRPGQGTTVVVQFPAASAAESV